MQLDAPEGPSIHVFRSDPKRCLGAFGRPDLPGAVGALAQRAASHGGGVQRGARARSIDRSIARARCAVWTWVAASFWVSLDIVFLEGMPFMGVQSQVSYGTCAKSPEERLGECVHSRGGGIVRNGICLWVWFGTLHQQSAHLELSNRRPADLWKKHEAFTSGVLQSWEADDRKVLSTSILERG